MSFYERYEKCCKEKGISPKSQLAADKLGCTKASISAFAKTGKAPSGSIVANAAKMLDVTADYLLEIIDLPRHFNLDFTNKELEILYSLRELNPEAQDCAQAMIQGLLTKGIYKKLYPLEKEIKVI